MDGQPDATLVAQALAGDKGAFGLLIERHQAMAGRVASGMVTPQETARELTQEALLQAYLSLDRLRDGGRFQSWLFGIVLNVCRSYLRARRIGPMSLEALAGGLRLAEELLPGVEPGPQEVAEARELHGIVLSAVGALSPKNRAATLMFYYKQLSVREIAAALGVSMAAVKGRLHKSRRELRESLLPVYVETYGSITERKEGVKPMVKVTIADVVPAESRGLHVVVLHDQAGRRVLPIYVQVIEATSIAMGLRDVEMPRPLSPHFAARILEASGAKLEEVRVQDLKDTTFYAVARLRIGDHAREIDARPSDAIALAVLTGSPIYVAEEVMEKAGKDIPEDMAEASPRGRGIDAIAEHLSQTFALPQHHDMMEYVFGTEAEESEHSH